jgi:hypothetical protein
VRGFFQGGMPSDRFQIRDDVATGRMLPLPRPLPVPLSGPAAVLVLAVAVEYAVAAVAAVATWSAALAAWS